MFKIYYRNSSLKSWFHQLYMAHFAIIYSALTEGERIKFGGDILQKPQPASEPNPSRLAAEESDRKGIYTHGW